MTKYTMSRRDVLQAAGATLALPYLEIMMGRKAFGQEILSPARFVVFLNGIGSGCDEDPTALYPNAPYGVTIPELAGTNFTLPSALSPLASLRNDVALVSGLRIPNGTGAGAISTALKAHQMYTLTAMTGTNISVGQNHAPYNFTPKGPTTDILMIKDLASTSTYQSLALRIDTSPLLTSETEMSHKVGAGGLIVPNTSNTSPLQVFQTLFGGLVPDLTATERARQTLLQDVRLRVVDSVKTRAEDLKKRLGKADQLRLDRHLAEVRDLERRVSALPPQFAGSCKIPTSPGADPTQYPDVGYYKGEKERALAMADLAYMALVCDLTRVIAIEVSVPVETQLYMKHISGFEGYLHTEIAHGKGNGTPDVRWQRHADAYKWHIGTWAYLLQKLRDTPDGSGNLLDRTMSLFIPDSGWSPLGGDSNTSGSHSSENSMIAVAGHLGGLKTGQHLKTDGAHPSSVILTAMRAAGYSGASLGAITTEVSGLRAGV